MELKSFNYFVSIKIEIMIRPGFLELSNKQIDLDSKMYQFDTTAEIGKIFI